MVDDLSQFRRWWLDRSQANDYSVARAPLDGLAGWSEQPGTGNLVHDSGRFFSIEGLEVSTDHREVTEWSQPIICQPEIGILGILVREFDGVLHCLMQAKMEPGNVNLLQLSPTVQATRSNYRRVHGGSAVPYLEHFVAPRRGRVVFDALQSEQGSWFLAKRNRNMIVEVTEEVPVLPDFCWLSVDQVATLMREDNLVNMDSRTVLAGLAFRGPSTDAEPRIVLAGQEVEDVHSWFTENKSRYRLERRRIPLGRTPSWVRTRDEIRREDGRFFSVIGVNVAASNREVRGWSQPMIMPSGQGVVAFVGRRIDGAFHLLVQARTEAGIADVVEMAPTVHCIPGNYRDAPAGQRPRYLYDVLSAPESARLVDVVHSEEGGRFYHAENRYLVVDVDESFSVDVPPDFLWVTPAQLMGFLRHGNLINVAARCLLACLTLGRPSWWLVPA